MGLEKFKGNNSGTQFKVKICNMIGLTYGYQIQVGDIEKFDLTFIDQDIRLTYG